MFQRIGMSIGTALAATFYFGHLTVLHRDYDGAAPRSLYGSAGLIAIAFVAASVDLMVTRRNRRGAARRDSAGEPFEQV